LSILELVLGHRLLDTSIFTRERTREEARRAHKLENIYHAGQEKIWNGREVLSVLVEKHGGVQMPLDVQRALARVFSSLMWGELAAWKISAQLADLLTDFEAKMAATSQVHDEARHFYVLHDYLELLDVEIPAPSRSTRMLLETVLGTESMAEKVVGMQLFVESMALTVFKFVRELRIEPVLSELLIFYERDEARHVGLGVQHAPELLRGISLKERMSLETFQLRILINSLVALKSLEPSFRRLGIEPRAIAEDGIQRMLSTLALIAQVNGRDMKELAGPVITRIFEATCEVMFPAPGSARSLRQRLWEAGRALYASSINEQRAS
jgi:hypothetical protein